MRSSVVILALLCGCSNKGTGTMHADMARGHDLATSAGGGGGDMTTGADLAPVLMFVNSPTTILANAPSKFSLFLANADSSSSSKATLSLNGGNGATLYSPSNGGLVFVQGSVTFPDVVIDLPGNGYTLTATVPGAGAVVSPTFDARLAWTKAVAGPTALNNLAAVVVAPNDSKSVYAATGDKLWKTSDGGNSWTPQGNGTTSYVATGLAVDGGNRIYAQLSTGDYISQLSTDQTAWTATTISGDQLQFSRVANESYVVATSSSFKYSVNGGAATTVATGLNIPANDPVTMLLDATTSGATTVLYWIDHVGVAPYVSGLYKSSDRGATWSPSIAPCKGALGAAIRSDGTLFVSCGGIAYRSSDRGVTFTPSTSVIGYPNTFAFAPGNANIVYGQSQYGILVSADGGKSFQPSGLATQCRTYCTLGFGGDPNDPMIAWVLSTSGTFKTTTAGQ